MCEVDLPVQQDPMCEVDLPVHYHLQRIGKERIRVSLYEVAREPVRGFLTTSLGPFRGDGPLKRASPQITKSDLLAFKYLAV